VRDFIATAWPSLEELGLVVDGADPDAVTFHADARAAVDGAGFIQESVPERLEIKHELYCDIEDVLGHPFNPPHLIPLVEVLGNDHTDDGGVKAAQAFYESVGKVTTEVRKEAPGYIANRLQAALWREAINLAANGVASVEDVDTAVWAGPGLRWAVMGPTMLFHLGAGEGGLTSFTERFNRWFEDLGELHLDPEVAAQLVAGIAEAASEQTTAELSHQRDALLAPILQVTAGKR